MGSPMATGDQRYRPVRRRARLTLLVITAAVAALFFLGGVATAWEALTFPSGLAHHPVNGTAVVLDSFINGFGGDPAVDYGYTLQGRSYRGWGESVPGNLDFPVKPGTVIPIQYARDNPADSCTCDAAHHTQGWKAFLEGAAGTLPLVIVLSVLCWPPWRRKWLGTDRTAAFPPTAAV